MQLSRARPYQFARRAALLGSLGLFAVIPLWHLGHIQRQSAGIAADGPWSRVAAWLPTGDPIAQGAPWTIRIFGIELMDPLAVLGLVVAHGFPLEMWLAALLPVALIGLFGRFFCGWLCPYVPLLALSNSVRALLARFGLSLPNVQLPRRAGLLLLASLLLGSSALGSQLAPLLYPPALIGRELFRCIFYGGLGAGALCVAAFFLFDTFVSRGGFCRSLCPGGALFAVLGAASPIRVQRAAQACTECTVCNVVCNLGQKPMSDQLDAGCDRCGKCVSVCPTGALRLGLGRPAALAEPSSPPGFTGECIDPP